ncbi:MAG: hypothetical protein ACRD4B_00270, partial [Acidobacteriota bacterium]
MLPTDIPLELLAHFRLVDGLSTVEEIQARIAEEGGVEAVMEKIDVAHYQDEIRKAIHAQATEAGVEKRELLQNALDAIRKTGRSEGKVSVDYYLRNEGREFVEKVTDTGIGIENLVAFLVPGITTKEATGEQGFFGTGFYKNLQDVDTIEVESVAHDGDQMLAYKMVIEVTKDEEGSTQGGKIRQLQVRDESPLVPTGTEIRLIKKAERCLPELEAMMAKNTSITMGGLTTVPAIAGIDLNLAFVDEEGREQSTQIPVADRSQYDIAGIGKMVFVKAPTLPSSLLSAGLRMASLYGNASDYLHAVPASLKRFFADEHISVVLPKELSLIKDRSRLANESEYLP